MLAVGRSEEIKIGHWVYFLWQGNKKGLMKIEQQNKRN